MNLATEPESFAELIADCAAIPASLHTAVPVPLRTISAPDWVVSERCHAQVAELDAFV